MESDWDFYFCSIEDLPASILVDLGLRESAPIEGLSKLLNLRLQMLHPNEDGLWSREEHDRLGEIEEALVSSVTDESLPVIHVGRVTWSGRRDFHFYTSDPAGVEQRLSQVMAGFPEYEFEIKVQSDPDWRNYFEFLFPSQREMQMIMTERVLRNLAEHGDDPEIPRDVSHFIVFPSNDQRDQFVRAAAELGFPDTVASEGDDEQCPFGLTVSRTQSARRTDIHDAVLQLYDLAQECGGDYDGWETSIERGDE